MNDVINHEPQIAILTAFGGIWGSGHYHRSVSISHLWHPSAVTRYVLCPEQLPPHDSSDPRKQISYSQLHFLVPHILEQKPLVLLIDRREFASPWIDFFEKKHNIRCALFDSVGIERPLSSLLIDAIPSLSEHLPSNLRGQQFLPYKKIPLPPQKSGVAAFFGNNDGSKLSLSFLQNLPQLRFCLPQQNPLSIFLYIGSANSSKYFQQLQLVAQNLDSQQFSCKVLWQIPNFIEVLSSYQLLFCHYGISCFQAIQTKTPFLLLSPSSYHYKLCLKYFPFVTASFNQSSITFPKKITSFQTVLSAFDHISQNMPVGNNFESIKPIINALTEKTSLWTCAVCSSTTTNIIQRKAHANFYLCLSCKNVSLKEIFPIEFIDPDLKIQYDQDYFFKEYQLSYGKTYEQDKQTIYKFSANRINIIKQYKSSGKILDIGCALGYFLDQAKISGFQTFGVEISEFASAIAKQNHTIFQQDFLLQNFPQNFDVISLWYVIEHFPAPAEVIKKIHSIHKKGGILAISTPNLHGISSRGNPTEFFKNSPNDHYVIFSPSSLKKLCKKYGYRLLKVKNTGIHLERIQNLYPSVYKLIPKKIIPTLVNLLNLGDTFEIYLKKVI